MQIKDPLIRDVLKMFCVVVGMIVLMRLTKGFFGVVMLALGVWFAITRNISKALMFYVLYPFFAILNGMVCPQMPGFAMVSRIGTMLMTGALMLASSSRQGREQLPLGGLFLYLFCAVLSSMDGYFPIISYLKILNFAVFVLGLYIGVRNIHHQPREMYRLRLVFLAVACVLVFGSLFVLVFAPGIAYSTSVRGLMVRGDTMADADALVSQIASNSGMLLFAGITNQSQCLSPMLSCVVAFVASDMVVSEKRMCRLHVALIACAIPLMYLTRSRTAFMALLVTVIMVYMYVMPKTKISAVLKKRITSGMYLALGLLMMAMVVMEVRNSGVSRLLRKTEDVTADERGFTEALTSSRMGKIELLMSDFKKNPLLGMGFQVMEEHKILYQMGAISLFSAPIEKGVLPVMVLAEGGLLGAFAFLVFLAMFYGTCKKKHYVATSTMFTIILTTNMSEATFFSPSGSGGFIWIYCLVGGFVVDMYSKYGLRSAVPMSPEGMRM